MEDYHIFQGENKVARAIPKTMGAPLDSTQIDFYWCPWNDL
jgi:hypothetical protein